MEKPIGPVTQADLDNISALKAAASLNAVWSTMLEKVRFCTKLLFGGLMLLLGAGGLGGSVGSSRADMVLPSSFLKCGPALTRDGSRIQSDPARIDEEFRKAWLPCFSRSVKRHACFICI